MNLELKDVIILCPDGIAADLIRIQENECDYNGRTFKLFIVPKSSSPFDLTRGEPHISVVPSRDKIPLPNPSYSKKRGRKKW